MGRTDSEPGQPGVADIARGVVRAPGGSDPPYWCHPLTGEETAIVESHAKLAGHAIHPMLIVFPLGLLATAVLFDLIYLLNGNAELVIFSYWAIAAGVIGGLLAALFGFWDWLPIPAGTRAKTIGLWHGSGNVIIVILFIIAWLLRHGERAPRYRPDGLPFVLEVIGVLLALVTGWLGGELVERLGVSVDRGANLDAPNSLSGQPTGEAIDAGEARS